MRCELTIKCTKPRTTLVKHRSRSHDVVIWGLWVQKTVNLLAPVGPVAERGTRYEPTYHYEGEGLKGCFEKTRGVFILLGSTPRFDCTRKASFRRITKHV